MFLKVTNPEVLDSFQSIAFNCDSTVIQTIRFAEEFEVESLLGEGFFGCVFKAKNRFDGWNYAVKRIVVERRYFFSHF